MGLRGVSHVNLSLNAGQGWDGEQSLGSFLRRLRSEADRRHLLILGVHIRTQACAVTVQGDILHSAFFFSNSRFSE